MMFGPARFAAGTRRCRARRTVGWRDPHDDGADRVGALAQCVDVVGEQAGMPVEHAMQRLVDGPVQRVDRAVALGRRSPFVLAGGDDHRAAAAGVAARRHGPPGEVQGRLGRAVVPLISGSPPWGRGGAGVPGRRA